jgi:hypothetical protein
MLPDLSVQLLNPSLLDLWTDPFFIDEFAEFILNLHFNLFYPWMQDIIDLCFDNVDVGLIETLMLLKNFSHSIINHFVMFCHHLRVLKVVCNQFLSELKEEDVLLPLFKSAVLSKPHVAIGELPEFLGELEPTFEGIGGRVLLRTALHEG